MSHAALVHVVDNDPSDRAFFVQTFERAGYDTREYPTTAHFLLNPAPDSHGCIVMEACMPGLSGVELQSALVGKQDLTPVIFVTRLTDAPTIVRAMKGGAIDFLSKPVGTQVLLDCVSRALDGDRQARALRAKRQLLHACWAALSQRQREVFTAVVAGKLNKEIAYLLGVAERTVKADRAQIMAIFGVHFVVQLGGIFEQLAGDRADVGVCADVTPDVTKVRHLPMPISVHMHT